MTERIPHIYSYTSAGNTGRPVHPMCVAMAASSHSTHRDWCWQSSGTRFPEPSQPAESPSITVPLTEREKQVLGELSVRQELPEDRVMIQALRLYQASMCSIPDIPKASCDQQAESPDDWVMITDPKHVLRSCDEVRYAEGSWHPCRASVGAKRGTQTWEEFRCRRKDLPVVPVESTALPQFPEGADNNTVLWVQAAAWTTIFKWCYDNGMPIGRGLNALQTLAQWILDLKASAKPQNHNAAPADKPRMRQVTLREYRHTDESTAWSSSGWLVESRLTGRTCVTEVPE